MPAHGRDGDGNRYVRCLYWNGRRWCRSYLWVSDPVSGHYDAGAAATSWDVTQEFLARYVTP